MSEKTASGTTTGTGGRTSSEKLRAVVSRVLSLSIFFVGIGVYAVIGFGLHQIALFSEVQLTYYAVGVAFGVVGVLLWLMTR